MRLFSVVLFLVLSVVANSTARAAGEDCSENPTLCRENSEPNTEAPSENPPEECSDCFGQLHPDLYCVQTCKCPRESVFCGAW
jgi:hypothetical protein